MHLRTAALLLGLVTSGAIGDLSNDLPPCASDGLFQGDLLTQPRGCCNDFECKEVQDFEQKRIEVPEDSFASYKDSEDPSGKSCPFAYTKVTVPLFALEQDKLRIVDIDQNKTQVLIQEFCDVYLCREAGIQCHQIHERKRMRLIPIEGRNGGYGDLYTSSRCECELPTGDGANVSRKRRQSDDDGPVDYSDIGMDDVQMRVPDPDEDEDEEQGSGSGDGEDRPDARNLPVFYAFPQHAPNGTGNGNGGSGGSGGSGGGGGGLPFPNGTGTFPPMSNMSNPDLGMGITNLETVFERRLNASSAIDVARIAQMGLVQTYAGCMAYRKHKPAAKCKFPFVYHGFTFNGCINQDDDQYWCPTELDENNQYISNEWGYCSADCPLLLPQCKTVPGGPQVKAFCHFPFRYKEVEFWTCTDLDDTRPWCATETDGHGFYIPGQWGYCQCNSMMNGMSTTTASTVVTTASTTTMSTTTENFCATIPGGCGGGGGGGGGGGPTTTMSTTSTTMSTTTTAPEVMHIPMSIMDQATDGIAVYIPSFFDDPFIQVIERSGKAVRRL